MSLNSPYIYLNGEETKDAKMCNVQSHLYEPGTDALPY